jgi:hypothetical protein
MSTNQNQIDELHAEGHAAITGAQPCYNVLLGGV